MITPAELKDKTLNASKINESLREKYKSGEQFQKDLNKIDELLSIEAHKSQNKLNLVLNKCYGNSLYISGHNVQAIFDNLKERGFDVRLGNFELIIQWT